MYVLYFVLPGRDIRFIVKRELTRKNLILQQCIKRSTRIKIVFIKVFFIVVSVLICSLIYRLEKSVMVYDSYVKSKMHLTFVVPFLALWVSNQ